MNLHFADLSPEQQRTHDSTARRPGALFDILLEGRTVHKGYSPSRVGHATADQVNVLIQVTDGFLDLELVSTPGSGASDDPRIAAIEIKPVVKRVGESP